jgi:ammonium transporter, Amt family
MKKFTLANFVQKMRDPEQRKYFYALFGAKLLGVGLVVIIMAVVSTYLGGATKAHAQAAPSAAASATNAPMGGVTNSVAGTNAPAAAPAPPAPPDPPYCSPINTLWVLVTAFLVFFMQAGFMFLEAGFA